MDRGRAIKEFWQDAMEMIAPGWQLEGAPAVSPEEGLKLNVNIYAVDIASGSLAFGRMTEQAMRSLMRRMSESEDRTRLAQSAAADAVRQYGRAVAGHDRAEGLSANDVLCCVAHALASSRTALVAAEAHGTVAGHWIYAAYAMRDGSVLGRPFAVEGNPDRAATPGQVRGWVRDVLALDLGGSGTTSTMIRQCGGVAEVASDFAV